MVPIRVTVPRRLSPVKQYTAIISVKPRSAASAPTGLLSETIVTSIADPRTALNAPTLADVFTARARLRPHLPPTPLVAAPALSEALGCDVRLKLETLQPIGAFKVRGGVNLIGAIQEGAEPRPRGFVTASTGNHGQSIAYAARLFDFPAVIFAPRDCNPIKADAIRRLGGELMLVGRDFDEARLAAEVHAREGGFRYVHPSDEPLLIAGVATASLEALEAWPEADAILVPLGGGSGACGACVVGKAVRPDLQVIAVQAAGAPAFYNSWRSGRLESTERVETFAEGLATRVAFALPLAYLREHLDEVVLVTDDELERAMVRLLAEAHLLAEAAGAASTAALAQPALRQRLAGKRVILMVTGANVTPASLRTVLDHQLRPA
jgi:threonine dehydratase